MHRPGLGKRLRVIAGLQPADERRAIRIRPESRHELGSASASDGFDHLLADVLESISMRPSHRTDECL